VQIAVDYYSPIKNSVWENKEHKATTFATVERAKQERRSCGCWLNQSQS